MPAQEISGALCLHRRPAALPPSTVRSTLVFVGVSGLNVLATPGRMKRNTVSASLIRFQTFSLVVDDDKDSLENHTRLVPTCE